MLVARLGGRKMVMGMLVILTGIAIDFTFGLSSNLLTLLIFVCTGFFLGNVGEHVCDTVRKAKGSKDSVPVNNVAVVVNEIDQRLKDISAVESQVSKNLENLTKVTQSNLEATNAVLNVIKMTGKRQ